MQCLIGVLDKKEFGIYPFSVFTLQVTQKFLKQSNKEKRGIESLCDFSFKSTIKQSGLR